MSDNANVGVKFRVLIVGAGPAGLAVAYAMRQSLACKQGQIVVRIVEKRSEEKILDRLGYPMHLSKDGRSSLLRLLAPQDTDNLWKARAKMGIKHDGITVTSHSRKRVYWMVRDIDSNPMVERGDLNETLKRGAGEVEYSTEITALEEATDGVNVRLIKRIGDGEQEDSVKVDLVVGADGMFSSTRNHIYTSDVSHSSKSSSTPGGFKKLSQTIVNLRSVSPQVRRWVPDEHGMNLLYGDSFSASIMPLPDSVYIALTIPSNWLESSAPGETKDVNLEKTVHRDFINDLKVDPGWGKRETYELWSADTTVGGRKRIVLIGDAAHGMVPFCGAGASAGIKDGVELARTILENYGRGEHKVPSLNPYSHQKLLISPLRISGAKHEKETIH
nr:hypothetical protein L204_05093 [Cryptococcus depauperatus CBS 7855]